VPARLLCEGVNHLEVTRQGGAAVTAVFLDLAAS
jgi:hypothetical protein